MRWYETIKIHFAGMMALVKIANRMKEMQETNKQADIITKKVYCQYNEGGFYNV